MPPLIGSVLGRKVNMGEYVDLAVVDEVGELRPFCSQLNSDRTQRLGRAGVIWLDERLAQCRGDRVLLSFRYVNQSVANPTDPARCHEAPFASRITALSPSRAD